MEKIDLENWRWGINPCAIAQEVASHIHFEEGTSEPTKRNARYLVERYGEYCAKMASNCFDTIVFNYLSQRKKKIAKRKNGNWVVVELEIMARELLGMEI